MCGGGCRPGAVDLCIGVMALLAEYNGVDGAFHIMDKLVNLAYHNEAGYGCALAAAHDRLGIRAASSWSFMWWRNYRDTESVHKKKHGFGKKEGSGKNTGRNNINLNPVSNSSFFFRSQPITNN